MNLETRHALSDFILKSATLIDRDQLEQWLDCFHESSSYLVLPRENHEAGRQLGLMKCDNKRQLIDRIAVLRHASKFNPHWDRHILSGTVLDSIDQDRGTIQTSTSFMVVQTQLNGVSTLFCSGSYEDEIALGEEYKLLKRVVILDTFTVSNCLAVPL